MSHESLEAALTSEPRPISKIRFAELVHTHAGEGRSAREVKNTGDWLEQNANRILLKLNSHIGGTDGT